MAQTVAEPTERTLDWAYVEEEHERHGLALTAQDRRDIRRWWDVFEAMTSRRPPQRDTLFFAFIEGRVGQIAGLKQAEVLP